MEAIVNGTMQRIKANRSEANIGNHLKAKEEEEEKEKAEQVEANS